MNDDITPYIRELAQQLAPPSAQPLRLMQGVVQSVEDDMSCTLTLSGGVVGVSGFRWLVDGYFPIPADIVWLLDGGPGQRFIIGTTRLSSSLRQPATTLGHQVVIDGSGSRAANNTSWPDSIQNFAYLSYNLSPSGSGTEQIRFPVYLSRGIYRLSASLLTGTNFGIAAYYFDGDLIGTHDSYFASNALSTKIFPSNDVTVEVPGLHQLAVAKNGTKNGASTEYYVGFVKAVLSCVGVI